MYMYTFNICWCPLCFACFMFMEIPGAASNVAVVNVTLMCATGVTYRILGPITRNIFMILQGFSICLRPLTNIL